jgi:hypothetical protein
MKVWSHQAGLWRIGISNDFFISSAEFVLQCGCLAGLEDEESRLTRGPGNCRVGGHWEGIEIRVSKISRPPFYDYQ